MWKKVLKWGILIALLGYVVAITIWSSAEASRHVCTGIEIEIRGESNHADSLAESSLERELRSYPQKIVGEHVNAINTLAIEKYLGRFSSLEQVNCILTTDNKLKVIATPMIPELRVFPDNGASYYLNKDGKRVKANAKFFVDVPIVQGDFNSYRHPRELLALVRFVESDPDLRLLISSYRIEKNGDILMIPRLGGHILNFGDTTRMGDKRAAILTAYRSILPHRGWQTYDTISVKFAGQVVCSRRDKKGPNDYSDGLQDTDLEEATLEGLENREESPEVKKSPSAPATP